MPQEDCLYYCGEEDMNRKDSITGNDQAPDYDHDVDWFFEPKCPEGDWLAGDEAYEDWLNWTVEDEYPTPPKFAHLETTPPKPQYRNSELLDDVLHARNQLQRKRCRGQKPRYKDDRRSPRFSKILLDHYVQTQEDLNDLRLEAQQDLANYSIGDSVYDEIWQLDDELKHTHDSQKRLEIEIRLHELDIMTRQNLKAA